MIYRRTRNNQSGVYYRKLTPKQQQQVIAKWKRKRKAGAIKCVDDFKLGCLNDHPEWQVWREIRRVRIEGQTTEKIDYALCLGKRFRVVKAKPSPITHNL